MRSSSTKKSAGEIGPMPVFFLDERLIFPHPILHDPEGLLAIGGDLSEERLLFAYRWGIFPWYHDDQPFLWWWTTPRLMMKPTEVHISNSLKRTLKKGHYRVSFDKDFSSVMEWCGRIKRKGQLGTWITSDMIEAYTKLHQSGHVHSVEVWEGNELVGGLYGVVSGKIFSGESMFALKSDASKVGFVHLALHLASVGFEWIDCQQDTPHMRRMGGYLVEESDYLKILYENNRYMHSHPAVNLF